MCMIDISLVFATAGPAALAEERLPDYMFMWRWSRFFSVQRIHSSERGQKQVTPLNPNSN